MDGRNDVTESMFRRMASGRIPARSSMAGQGRLFRLLLIAALSLTVLTLCPGCEVDKTTPAHLIGTWSTTDQKFIDRHLVFTETTIGFGQGEGRKVTYAITKIVKKDSAAEAVHTFHYLDGEGEEWTLDVRRFPANGGTIRIQNSQVAWKKSEAGGP